MSLEVIQACNGRYPCRCPNLVWSEGYWDGDNWIEGYWYHEQREAPPA